ncbi:MAG: stalled ribosome rescue protein Dom34 [Spirosomataceae bacterium]|jgi:stalled ribosome rescue protein Dom34
METIKNLGIWMDHSVANLIDLDRAKNSHTITSKFTADVQDQAIRKNENLMHNKRQQMNEAFYKEIADEILKYDHVLLFGPTNAKTELHNFLNKDLHFKDIKICIEPTDKMTENQKSAFVKNHFETI